jgi:tetratricopeptide (TPR) repeat protein
VKRARAAVQKEEYDEALVLLSDAMRADPRNADALWDLAVLYDKHLQCADKAQIAYRRFKQLFPSDPRSRQFSTNAVVVAPSRPVVPPQAQPHPSAPSDSKSQARDLWRQALAYHQSGKWDDAIASYRRALQLDPKFTDAAYNLGFSYKAKGDLNKAREAYEQALKIRPDMVEAEYMLGVVCKDLHEGDAAIEHVKRALDKRPAYAEAHFLLGLLYRDATRYDLARAHFERAVQLAPDEAFAQKARTWFNATAPQ